MGQGVHSRSLAAPSGKRCHPSAPVPPSQFLTALTICSTSAWRVCCAPLPVGCSPRFTDPRTWDCSRARGPLLATLFTPFEDALVDSRSASPRSVPSCRLLRLRGGVGCSRNRVSEVARCSSHLRAALHSPPGEGLVWAASACAGEPLARLPHLPCRGRPLSAVSREHRLATRALFADPFDQPGWLGVALAGSAGCSTRESTL